jgi:hypothetical protein
MCGHVEVVKTLQAAGANVDLEKFIVAMLFSEVLLHGVLHLHSGI